MVKQFLQENSFHDAYVVAMRYYKEFERVRMNVVQLYSEISVPCAVKEEIAQDDLVEIELYVQNVYYVDFGENNYFDYEIIDIVYEQKNEGDILLFKLHMYEDYREFCIKGKKIKISGQIVKKVY